MTNLPDKKPALEEDLDRLQAIPLAGGDIQELADGIKAHRKAYTLSIVPEKEKDLPADARAEDYAIPNKAEYLLLSVNAFHFRPQSREGFKNQIQYVKALPEWEVIFDKEGTTLFRKRI